MTDQELLKLMPETLRDEFSYAARVCSDATGGKVKPGTFRVALNTAALEYAHAVLGAAEREVSEVYQISKPLKLTAKQQEEISALLRPVTSQPSPNPSQIRSSLLERVLDAIIEGGRQSLEDEARAAIREVAAWLREQHDGDLVAVTVLEREAGR